MHQRCQDFLIRSTSYDRVCGFLSKKNCMKLLNATSLDRKSGIRRPKATERKRDQSSAFARPLNRQNPDINTSYNNNAVNRQKNESGVPDVHHAVADIHLRVDLFQSDDARRNCARRMYERLNATYPHASAWYLRPEHFAHSARRRRY